MQLKRQFERRGSLWVPDYKVTPERLRYERYKKRFLPQAAFTHVRGAQQNAASGTSVSVVMGAAPVLGNCVCVGVAFNAAVTGVTVQDGAGTPNPYTVSSGSPSTFQTGAGQVWLAYLLSAPATASATITISWTTSTGVQAWADEFSYTGTLSFDKDAKANTGVAGTTVNTPTITPIAAGELLFACVAAGGTVSAPAAAGTLGVWTGAAGGIVNGDDAEYNLSSGTGAIAVQFTQSSGGWSTMAMALTTGGGSFVPDEDAWSVNKGTVPDSVITVF